MAGSTLFCLSIVISFSTLIVNILWLQPPWAQYAMILFAWLIGVLGQSLWCATYLRSRIGPWYVPALAMTVGIGIATMLANAQSGARLLGLQIFQDEFGINEITCAALDLLIILSFHIVGLRFFATTSDRLVRRTFLSASIIWLLVACIGTVGDEAQPKLAYTFFCCLLVAMLASMLAAGEASFHIWRTSRRRKVFVNDLELLAPGNCARPSPVTVTRE